MFLIAIAVLAIIACSISFMFPAYRVAAIVEVKTYTDEGFTSEIYDLTDNMARKTFIRNSNLQYLAEQKLDDMVKNNYWSHVNKQGDIMWGKEYLVDRGDSFTKLGENLARGYKTPEDMMTAWQGSPKHYANIIDPKFTDIGIACDNRKGGFICVQRFSD